MRIDIWNTENSAMLQQKVVYETVLLIFYFLYSIIFQFLIFQYLIVFILNFVFIINCETEKIQLSLKQQ